VAYRSKLRGSAARVRAWEKGNIARRAPDRQGGRIWESQPGFFAFSGSDPFPGGTGILPVQGHGQNVHATSK